MTQDDYQLRNLKETITALERQLRNGHDVADRLAEMRERLASYPAPNLEEEV